MNQYAMHNMVEYIKTQEDFPFDALDLEESLEAVLAYFGFHPQLGAAEREQLLEDLRPLALADELGEMQHLAQAEPMSPVSDLGQPQHLWLKVLARQPKSVCAARFVETLRLG